MHSAALIRCANRLIDDGERTSSAVAAWFADAVAIGATARGGGVHSGRSGIWETFLLQWQVWVSGSRKVADLGAEGSAGVACGLPTSVEVVERWPWRSRGEERVVKDCGEDSGDMPASLSPCDRPLPFGEDGRRGMPWIDSGTFILWLGLVGAGGSGV